MQKPDSVVARQRYILKELALCECLHYGFKQDSLYKKDFSASLLTEQSDYLPEAHEMVDSVMKRFAEAIPATRHRDLKRKRGIMVQCIDYYNSSELDVFIKSLDKFLDTRPNH